MVSFVKIPRELLVLQCKLSIDLFISQFSNDLQTENLEEIEKMVSNLFNGKIKPISCKKKLLQ